MAKIESGSLDFTYSQIDINELMEEICSQMILKHKNDNILYLLISIVEIQQTNDYSVITKTK